VKQSRELQIGHMACEIATNQLELVGSRTMTLLLV